MAVDNMAEIKTTYGAPMPAPTYEYFNHEANPFALIEYEGESEVIISPKSPTARKGTLQYETSTSPGTSSTHRTSPRKPSLSSLSPRAPAMSTPYISPPAPQAVLQPERGIRFSQVNWRTTPAPVQQPWQPDDDVQVHVYPVSALSSTQDLHVSRISDTNSACETTEKSQNGGLGIRVVQVSPRSEEMHDTSPWMPIRPELAPATYHATAPCKSVIIFEAYEDIEAAPRTKASRSPSRGVGLKRWRWWGDVRARFLLVGLLMLIPFVVIPLAFFGGVYHWGTKSGLCEAGGGHWISATDRCQY